MKNKRTLPEKKRLKKNPHKPRVVQQKVPLSFHALARMRELHEHSMVEHHWRHD